MKSSELELRAIRDRIAAAMGELEEASSAAELKPNYARLANAADELYNCAADIRRVLMLVRRARQSP